MTLFLGLLPLVSTLLALLLGARSLLAALLGVGSALLAILLAFPVPPESILPALLRWTPLLTEVLMIVAGGLLISEVLRQAGGQAAIAKWIAARSQDESRRGGGVAAVLLVVHGITPFAESLTGFGIGITIGIPLLAHFGLPARKVVVIGLLGLCAVPWGSMAPGTLIAARMADLSFQDLGVASAVVNLMPFLASGLAAAWLASPEGARGGALLQGLISGTLLTVAVTLANLFFGTPPAGALGGLAVIGLHLLRGKAQGAAPLAPIGRRTLAAYGLLLGGVLVTGWITRAASLPEGWRYIASPALWLFIAVFWFARGRPAPEVTRQSFAAWRQVAPVTGLFILLGILMAVSGMAAFLAQTLARTGTAYLAAAPFVGAAGGFVTGSTSGANAMLATTQAGIARSLGVDVLWFMAIHNVAAGFLLMASPGKVEMALQLAPPEAAAHRAWIQAVVLGLAMVVVTLLVLPSLLLAWI